MVKDVLAIAVVSWITWAVITRNRSLHELVFPADIPYMGR